jgi:hypothetical protein
MTIYIANVVQGTDSFGQWLAKTNLAIGAISNSAVTTNSNTAVGNAAITGVFTADTYVTSNSGSVYVSFDTANTIINATATVIKSSSTSNNIITASGMLIDGSTAYTKTLISMGNTIVRTANVTTDNGYFTNNIVVGTNTFFYDGSIVVDQANIMYGLFGNNIVVGDSDANTYIDRNGIFITYNDSPTSDSNTYLTAFELKVKKVTTEQLDLGSNSLFTGNVFFLGSNNYFSNGLGSAGDIDIVGAGRHFSHGFYSNAVTANIAFMFNGNDGSANFSRNLYQNSSNNIIFNNTRAEIINLANGSLTVASFPNATPGTSVSSGNAIILSANTNKAYFANNLGVGGITNPLDALHVEGAIRLESPSGNGHVRLLAPNTNVNFDIILPDKKGKLKQVLVLVDEDNGTIGFDDNPGSDKDNVDGEFRSIGVGVNAPGGGSSEGEIRAKGNVIAYYSDERLKDVLGPINNALDKVSQLEGFYYKPNEIARNIGYKDARTHVGVSAQKTQEVLPEVVYPAPIGGGYLTVQYDKIVPLLIEAIKELKAEVDRLKNGN